MREVLRLALILAVVGIVSALVLTGVNSLTEPVIAEREADAYRQALEEYFPEMSGFKTEQMENDRFDLVYDGKGKLLGVMATASQQGYDGDINYNLAINAEGVIIGLRIISHTESPGIGDVIETEGFQSRLIGKSYNDEIKAGVDVDTVSGATISTTALINSVGRVVHAAAENFLDLEEEEPIDISLLPDGTYRGSAWGDKNIIVVDVTVKDGRIFDIDLVEHADDPTYMAEAWDVIPGQIMEQQSTEVDTRTGATGSSRGIVNAVLNALENALESLNEGQDFGDENDAGVGGER